MEKKPAGMFTRQATGLVRDLTIIDAFIIAVGISNIPFGGSAGYGFFGFLYPGASPAFAFAVAAVPVILIALVYVYFGSAMPRSGGDYVFLSRTVHPWYGFMMNFSITLSIFFAIGLDCFYLSTLMLSPGFGAMGLSLHNNYILNLATQFTQPTTAFAIGAVVIALMTAVLALRIRVIQNVNRVLFAISMLGTVVVFVLLAVTSNSAFVSDFNTKLSGVTTYSGIIQTASQNGWKSVAPAFLPTILAAAPAVVFLGEGPTFPVYVAGEMRSVKKAIPIALIGGTLFGALLDFVGGLLLQNSAGYNFMSAAGYLYFGTSHYPISIAPWLNFYAGILTNNVVLLSIIAIYMALAMVLNMLAFLLTATRSIFAWSFDRVVPEVFSRISDRTHSPVLVAIMCGIGSLVALWIAAFTTYLSFFLNGTIWFAVDLLLVALAGIVFAYRRRELYNLSIWKRSIAGVPLLTIIAIAATASLAWVTYAATVTPAIGPTSFGSYLIILMSFVIPTVLYAAAYYYRKKKQGINLSLLYREIPPE